MIDLNDRATLLLQAKDTYKSGSAIPLFKEDHFNPDRFIILILTKLSQQSLALESCFPHPDVTCSLAYP